MSLVIRFAPPSLTAQQYDDVVRRLTDAGVFPSEGLDYELCFGAEDHLKAAKCGIRKPTSTRSGNGYGRFWPRWGSTRVSRKCSRSTTSSSSNPRSHAYGLCAPALPGVACSIRSPARRTAAHRVAAGSRATRRAARET